MSAEELAQCIALYSEFRGYISESEFKSNIKTLMEVVQCTALQAADLLSKSSFSADGAMERFFNGEYQLGSTREVGSSIDHNDDDDDDGDYMGDDDDDNDRDDDIDSFSSDLDSEDDRTVDLYRDDNGEFDEEFYETGRSITFSLGLQTIHASSGLSANDKKLLKQAISKTTAAINSIKQRRQEEAAAAAKALMEKNVREARKQQAQEAKEAQEAEERLLKQINEENEAERLNQNGSSRASFLGIPTRDDDMEDENTKKADVSAPKSVRTRKISPNSSIALSNLSRRLSMGSSTSTTTSPRTTPRTTTSTTTKASRSRHTNDTKAQSSMNDEDGDEIVLPQDDFESFKANYTTIGTLEQLDKVCTAAKLPSVNTSRQGHAYFSQGGSVLFPDYCLPLQPLKTVQISGEAKKDDGDDDEKDKESTNLGTGDQKVIPQIISPTLYTLPSSAVAPGMIVSSHGADINFNYGNDGKMGNNNNNNNDIQGKRVRNNTNDFGIFDATTTTTTTTTTNPQKDNEMVQLQPLSPEQQEHLSSQKQLPKSQLKKQFKLTTLRLLKQFNPALYHSDLTRSLPDHPYRNHWRYQLTSRRTPIRNNARTVNVSIRAMRPFANTPNQTPLLTHALVINHLAMNSDDSYKPLLELYTQLITALVKVSGSTGLGRRSSSMFDDHSSSATTTTTSASTTTAVSHSAANTLPDTYFTATSSLLVQIRSSVRAYMSSLGYSTSSSTFLLPTPYTVQTRSSDLKSPNLTKFAIKKPITAGTTTGGSNLRHSMSTYIGDSISAAPTTTTTTTTTAAATPSSTDETTNLLSEFTYSLNHMVNAASYNRSFYEDRNGAINDYIDQELFGDDESDETFYSSMNGDYNNTANNLIEVQNFADTYTSHSSPMVLNEISSANNGLIVMKSSDDIISAPSSNPSTISTTTTALSSPMNDNDNTRDNNQQSSLLLSPTLAQYFEMESQVRSSSSRSSTTSNLTWNHSSSMGNGLSRLATMRQSMRASMNDDNANNNITMNDNNTNNQDRDALINTIVQFYKQTTEADYFHLTRAFSTLLNPADYRAVLRSLTSRHIPAAPVVSSPTNTTTTTTATTTQASDRAVYHSHELLEVTHRYISAATDPATISYTVRALNNISNVWGTLTSLFPSASINPHWSVDNSLFVFYPTPTQPLSKALYRRLFQIGYKTRSSFPGVGVEESASRVSDGYYGSPPSPAILRLFSSSLVYNGERFYHSSNRLHRSTIVTTQPTHPADLMTLQSTQGPYSLGYSSRSYYSSEPDSTWSEANQNTQVGAVSLSAESSSTLLETIAFSQAAIVPFSVYQDFFHRLKLNTTSRLPPGTMVMLNTTRPLLNTSEYLQLRAILHSLLSHGHSSHSPYVNCIVETLKLGLREVKVQTLYRVHSARPVLQGSSGTVQQPLVYLHAVDVPLTGTGSITSQQIRHLRNTNSGVQVRLSDLVSHGAFVVNTPTNREFVSIDYNRQVVRTPMDNLKPIVGPMARNALQSPQLHTDIISPSHRLPSHLLSMYDGSFDLPQSLPNPFINSQHHSDQLSVSTTCNLFFNEKLFSFTRDNALLTNFFYPHDFVSSTFQPANGSMNNATSLASNQSVTIKAAKMATNSGMGATDKDASSFSTVYSTNQILPFLPLPQPRMYFGAEHISLQVNPTVPAPPHSPHGTHLWYLYSPSAQQTINSITNDVLFPTLQSDDVRLLSQQLWDGSSNIQNDLVKLSPPTVAPKIKNMSILSPTFQFSLPVLLSVVKYAFGKEFLQYHHRQTGEVKSFDELNHKDVEHLGQFLSTPARNISADRPFVPAELSGSQPGAQQEVSKGGAHASTHNNRYYGLCRELFTLNQIINHRIILTTLEEAESWIDSKLNTNSFSQTPQDSLLVIPGSNQMFNGFQSPLSLDLGVTNNNSVVNSTTTSTAASSISTLARRQSTQMFGDKNNINITIGSPPASLSPAAAASASSKNDHTTIEVQNAYNTRDNYRNFGHNSAAHDLLHYHLLPSDYIIASITPKPTLVGNNDIQTDDNGDGDDDLFSPKKPIKRSLDQNDNSSSPGQQIAPEFHIKSNQVPYILHKPVHISNIMTQMRLDQVDPGSHNNISTPPPSIDSRFIPMPLYSPYDLSMKIQTDLRSTETLAQASIKTSLMQAAKGGDNKTAITTSSTPSSSGRGKKTPTTTSPSTDNEESVHFTETCQDIIKTNLGKHKDTIRSLNKFTNDHLIVVQPEDAEALDNALAQQLRTNTPSQPANTSIVNKYNQQGSYRTLSGQPIIDSNEELMRFVGEVMILPSIDPDVVLASYHDLKTALEMNLAVGGFCWINNSKTPSVQFNTIIQALSTLQLTVTITSVASAYGVFENTKYNTNLTWSDHQHQPYRSQRFLVHFTVPLPQLNPSHTSPTVNDAVSSVIMRHPLLLLSSLQEQSYNYKKTFNQCLSVAPQSIQAQYCPFDLTEEAKLYDLSLLRSDIIEKRQHSLMFELLFRRYTSSLELLYNNIKQLQKVIATLTTNHADVALPLETIVSNNYISNHSTLSLQLALYQLSPNEKSKKMFQTVAEQYQPIELQTICGTNGHVSDDIIELDTRNAHTSLDNLKKQSTLTHLVKPKINVPSSIWSISQLYTPILRSHPLFNHTINTPWISRPFNSPKQLHFITTTIIGNAMHHPLNQRFVQTLAMLDELSALPSDPLRLAIRTTFSPQEDYFAPNVHELLYVNLHDYQQQTVNWSLREERSTHNINQHVYEPIITGTGRLLWVSIPHMLVRTHLPVAARGGICAEDMGAGKTLISIALITGNPRPLQSPYSWQEEHEKQWDGGKIIISSNLIQRQILLASQTQGVYNNPHNTLERNIYGLIQHHRNVTAKKKNVQPVPLVVAPIVEAPKKPAPKTKKAIAALAAETAAAEANKSAEIATVNNNDDDEDEVELSPELKAFDPLGTLMKYYTQDNVMLTPTPIIDAKNILKIIQNDAIGAKNSLSKYTFDPITGTGSVQTGDDIERIGKTSVQQPVSTTTTTTKKAAGAPRNNVLDMVKIRANRIARHNSEETAIELNSDNDEIETSSPRTTKKKSTKMGDDDDDSSDELFDTAPAKKRGKAAPTPSTRTTRSRTPPQSQPSSQNVVDEGDSVSVGGRTLRKRAIRQPVIVENTDDSDSEHYNGETEEEEEVKPRRSRPAAAKKAPAAKRKTKDSAAAQVQQEIASKEEQSAILAQLINDDDDGDAGSKKGKKAAPKKKKGEDDEDGDEEESEESRKAAAETAASTRALAAGNTHRHISTKFSATNAITSLQSVRTAPTTLLQPLRFPEGYTAPVKVSKKPTTAEPKKKKVAEALYQQGSIWSGATLIVAVPTTIGQWIRELHTYAPSLSICLLYDANREKDPIKIAAYDVVITSYQVAATEAQNGTIAAIDWWRVVYDEGHSLRDTSTVRNRALSLTTSANRWLLTGTPYNNSPQQDMVGLLRILSVEKPGSLHLNYFYRNILSKMTIRHIKSQPFNGRSSLVSLPQRHYIIHHVTMTPQEQYDYARIYTKAYKRFRLIADSTAASHFSFILTGMMNSIRRTCAIGNPEVDSALSNTFFSQDLTSLIRRVQEIARSLPPGQQIDLSQLAEAVADAYQDVTMGDECVVCLCEFTDPVQTKCGHVYCRECIEGILHTASSWAPANCPMCRKPVGANDLTIPKAVRLAREEKERQEMEAAAALATTQPTTSTTDDLQEDVKAQDNDKLIPELGFDPSTIQYDFTTNPFEAVNRYSKLKELMKIISQTTSRGEKTVIFSQYTHSLDLIRDVLVAGGIGVRQVNGAMSSLQRDKMVNEFNDNDAVSVFLLSVRVGSVGLTLTSANNLVLLEPCLNVSHQVQAENRVFRLGQTKDVNIHYLISVLPKKDSDDVAAAAATSLTALAASTATGAQPELDHIPSVEQVLYDLNESRRSKDIADGTSNPIQRNQPQQASGFNMTNWQNFYTCDPTSFVIAMPSEENDDEEAVSA